MNVSEHIGLMVRTAGAKWAQADIAIRGLATLKITCPVRQAVNIAQESVTPAVASAVTRR